MKGKQLIWKSLMMVAQIGISMLTPIFLCVYIGVKLDQVFHTQCWFLIMLFLGIASAFQSVYRLTRRFYSKDLTREIEEQKYFDDLKKERDRKGK